MCKTPQKNVEPVLNSNIVKELRKRVVESFLDVIVLEKLNEGHGLMNINDLTSFVYQEFLVLPSKESMLALLDSFEKDGLIISQDNKGTKGYFSTKKGEDTIKLIMQAKPEIINSILEFLLIEL